MISGSETVLVTGAAGFIGSAVAARLADDGFQVVGCDNFNSHTIPRLKQDRVSALLLPRQVPCIRADLSNAEEVNELFQRYRPQYVVHLAAQPGVRQSLQHPAACVQANLVAFGHVIEASRREAVRHFVYASSSSVYGVGARIPFAEDDNTDAPVSLYAATKKSNELSAHCYSHVYRLPATGLRFFTVYGPWGRPDMAYFGFTEKMLAGQAITVFAEGALLRDFTYIDDIVEGVVRVLRKPPDGTRDKTPHAVFNIGNHTPVRVLDFIRLLENTLGVQAKMEFLPMQAGDVPVTCADTTRLQDWVGFRPSTSLESGLPRFTDWYRRWAGVQRR